MGMEVSAYYNMLYPDLLLKMDGFSDRIEREERMFRKVGFSSFVSGGLAPKGITEEKYWPIRSDKNAVTTNFKDKKEAFRELLEIVNNGKA